MISVAILVAGVVGAFLSPTGGVCAMVAATPLIFDPIGIGGGSYSLLELAIVTGGLGIAVRVGTDSLIGQTGEPILAMFRLWNVSLVAVGLLIAGVTSLATLADPGHRSESVREFRLVIAEPVIFFACLRWVFQDPRSRRLVGAVLTSTGAVVGLYAIGKIALGDEGVVADGVRRATGPYPHPNNLALFLERIVVFSLTVALVGRWRRQWFALGGLLALAGVAATYSRGAALAITVGMVVVLLWDRRREAVWLTLGGAGVVVLVMSLSAGDRVLDTGSTGAESTRVLIWRSSLRMALDHPVWGVGLDQFLTQYWPRYVDPAGWPERYTSHPHNILLDVWLRIGILGVAVSAWGSFVVLSMARAAFRNDQRDDAYAIAAVAALATGCTHGLVDNGFFLPDLAVLTFLAIAMLETRTSAAATRAFEADRSVSGDAVRSLPPRTRVPTMDESTMGAPQ